MQQWEYMTLSRNRGFSPSFINYEAKPWDKDIPAMLPELGKEGWELAGIASNSSDANKYTSGFTNEETWVFKRPLES